MKNSKASHTFSNFDNSYSVSIQKTPDGSIHLEVQENSIITVSRSLTVEALATVLTFVNNKGFQNILDEHYEEATGVDKVNLTQIMEFSK